MLSRFLDESVRIWISGEEEKYLRLDQVSRIIPGQHTISKDKDAAKVLFTGLKALISHGHNWKGRPESRSDGISSEATSPKEHTPTSSDGTAGYMKGLNGDAYRVSLSSSVSSSNQGSGHYDGDALGNAFIWGEGTCDGVFGGVIHRTGNSSERIGFSWGVKSDGRLRDGVDSNVSHPKLIDSLKNINVELVACGEYHSCVVSLSGEMYSWGGSSGNFGLLGSGSETSQWIPKNLNGPLEGIDVSSVSCGSWHTVVDLLSLLLDNYLLLVMEHFVFWDMMTAKVYLHPGKWNSPRACALSE
ncbi:hypothetical protein V6N12_024755 [Hibiscus sabdariffa]|uniref:Uncharacterized protein n=1 Tax=Hibiscus sabdariffa TaxID=183260 RepID=A0ABR2BF53_9ROSI